MDLLIRQRGSATESEIERDPEGVVAKIKAFAIKYHRNWTIRP
jgi:hypothetical protein